MNRLADKVALVTGASRGIGRAIAETFLEEGAKVALCARSVPELESLADAWNQKSRRALPIECDVSSAESVDRAIEELELAWGKLHIVVNNAGISGRTPLEPDSGRAMEADPGRQPDRELPREPAAPCLSSSPVEGASSTCPPSSAGSGSRATPPTARRSTGSSDSPRALALELAPRGITVNAICPGWVETDMAEQGIRQTADELGISAEAFREQAIDGVPLRRFMEPVEIAKLALFLASDDAAAVTGQAYNICGGQVMN